MINWSRKPYNQEEFEEAWEKATFANDAAYALLGSECSISSVRTLNRVAESLNLKKLPVWTRDFSVEEFKESWEASLTAKEAAQKLGTQNTQSFRELAKVLELPEKLKDTGVKASYSKEEFISVWNTYESLDEVATALEVSHSKQSFAKMLKIANSLGLSAKKAKVYITDTGEDASIIIADWIDWYRNTYEVNPLDTRIKMGAKQVKELIKAGYPSEAIKWGLYKWTRSIDQGYENLNVINTETHNFYLRSNAKALHNAQQLANFEAQHRIEPVTANELLSIEDRAW